MKEPTVLPPGFPFFKGRADTQWFRTVQETLCFHIWTWSRGDGTGLYARMPLSALIKAVKRQFPRKMVLGMVNQMESEGLLTAFTAYGEIRLSLTADAFAMETDRAGYLRRVHMDGEG